MKTLAELRQKIIALPCRFAEDLGNSDVDESIAAEDLGEDKDSEVTFRYGFPIVFSQDPHDSNLKGKYIQRNDINRIGEIASRESLFKQAGGIHEYSESVVEKLSGYPKGSMIGYYDDTSLTRMESQESYNPNTIVTETLQYHKTWKPVTYIDGIDDDAFFVDLAYNEGYEFTQSGTVKEDSFVVGVINSWGGIPTTTQTSCKDVGADEPNIVAITNKGHSADSNGGFYIYIAHLIIVVVDGKRSVIYFVEPVYMPVISSVGGTVSYSFSFFAKAGTQLSCSIPVLWTVIPMHTRVG